MATQFLFDQAALPQVLTRKALILVDFQEQFLGRNALLQSRNPQGFIERALELASAFRHIGLVVWVTSVYDQPQLVKEGQLVLGYPENPDKALLPSDQDRVVQPTTDGQVPDEEAFLARPTLGYGHVRKTPAQVPSFVREAIGESDIVVSKTSYSAFGSADLLRSLRAKLVTEVFICGTMANIGVYATAMDAAGHGMSITVVEDCCGYRIKDRRTRAFTNLVTLTGCEIVSQAEVIESLVPRKKAMSTGNSDISGQLLRRSVQSHMEDRTSDRGRKTSCSRDIVRNMDDLKLAAASPTRTNVGTDSVIQVHDRDLSSQPSDAGLLVQGRSKDMKNESIAGTITSPDTIVDCDASGETAETIGAAESNLSKDAQSRLVDLSSSSPTTAIHQRSDGHGLVSRPAVTSSGGAHHLVDERPCPQQRKLCSGDLDIFEPFLPPFLEEGLFNKLHDEIVWQAMVHQGGAVPRLVAVQGLVGEDGSMPIYRHPSDQAPSLRPFSPTVEAIKSETEKYLGHQLNHVLIQYYRNGNDHISEHSDKTLDIVKKSSIANVSIGAMRTMVLRTKQKERILSSCDGQTLVSDGQRTVQRAQLPHNSLCRMGPQTNKEWLHAIRQDKRAERDKSAAELAFNGGRISLTFRHIGTFLDKHHNLIWGQGARAKTQEFAQPVLNGQSSEVTRMLKAFGEENRSSDFDWNTWYGNGFDVLHMSNAPRLFTSGDPLANLRVNVMLSDLGVLCQEESLDQVGQIARNEESGESADAGFPMKFIDNDSEQSSVYGELAILLYLNTRYRRELNERPSITARQYTGFQRVLQLNAIWRQTGKVSAQNLEKWDHYLQAADYMASDYPTLPDYALWPLLHALVTRHGSESLRGLSHLQRYYNLFKEREAVRQHLNTFEGDSVSV